MEKMCSLIQVHYVGSLIAEWKYCCCFWAQAFMEPTWSFFWEHLEKWTHEVISNSIYVLKKKKKKSLFIAFWVVLSIDLLPSIRKHFPTSQQKKTYMCLCQFQQIGRLCDCLLLYDSPFTPFVFLESMEGKSDVLSNQLRTVKWWSCFCS